MKLNKALFHQILVRIPDQLRFSQQVAGVIWKCRIAFTITFSYGKSLII